MAKEQLIAVPFHGANLSLIDHNGKPYAAMKPIIEAMGMDWASQFTKIKARFGSTIVEIATVAEDGKQRPMTCLPLRKLPGWLMSIHPNKVRAEIREQVITYQNECDDALWDYWTKGQAMNPRTEPEAGPSLTDLALRQQKAMEAANLVAAAVQLQVFKQLSEGAIGFSHERYLLSFGFSSNGAVPTVMKIERDACIASLSRLAEMISDPGGMLPSNADLANLARACNQRLSQRLGNDSRLAG